MRADAFCLVAGAPLALTAPLAAAQAFTPWADRVVEYTPGDGVPVGFDDPTTALGEPERFTGEGVFPGAVTVFNPPFGMDEIVSIGDGGSLTVAFDEPVTDDATNPFGIDLLVFGNAGYIDAAFPDGIVGGIFADGGLIELSDDGVTFVPVPGLQADGAFPTLGYLDLTDPFSPTAGIVESDFTKPVDPALDPDGFTFAEVVAAYDGSGGGVGIDIASVGLVEVSFVRITPTVGATPEVDGFADVRATCPADTDGDGELTVFDFLAFQSRFAASDARADCTGDGVLNVFDFLCFINDFGVGCP
ncbi:MAG: GC-type dockerin domain-anchored protein [Planctomycetota bacterium]